MGLQDGASVDWMSEETGRFSGLGCRGFRLWGFRVSRVSGFGFRVQGLGFRVQALAFMVQRLGFRV